MSGHAEIQRLDTTLPPFFTERGGGLRPQTKAAAPSFTTRRMAFGRK